MLEGFFDPAVWPFTVAICLMLLIALTEAMGMLIGISAFGFVDQLLPEADMDADVDADADVAGGDGLLSGVLGWLCIGKVPVLVLLVAFLTAFGLVGWSLKGSPRGSLADICRSRLPRFWRCCWRCRRCGGSRSASLELCRKRRRKRSRRAASSAKLRS